MSATIATADAGYLLDLEKRIHATRSVTLEISASSAECRTCERLATEGFLKRDGSRSNDRVKFFRFTRAGELALEALHGRQKAAEAAHLRRPPPRY